MEEGVDVFLDLPEPVLKGLVASRRQLVQVLDDLKDVCGDPGTPGTDKVHSEGSFPCQGLVDLRHDVQGLVVGIQEELEVVVPGLELDPKWFDFGLVQAPASGEEIFQTVQHSAHAANVGRTFRIGKRGLLSPMVHQCSSFSPSPWNRYMMANPYQTV